MSDDGTLTPAAQAYVESATAGRDPPSSPFEGAYFAAAPVEFFDLMAGR